MSLVPSGVSNDMFEENLINTSVIGEQTKGQIQPLRKKGSYQGSVGNSVGYKLS